MTVDSGQTARRTCGCGGASGGGGASGAGCGCGGGCGGGCGDACGGAGGQYTYVRPRFFAGQLLTNDDLDLLGSLAGAQKRLPNPDPFWSRAGCGVAGVWR